MRYEWLRIGPAAIIAGLLLSTTGCEDPAAGTIELPKDGKNDLNAAFSKTPTDTAKVAPQDQVKSIKRGGGGPNP
jgi:hypothetical protein